MRKEMDTMPWEGAFLLWIQEVVRCAVLDPIFSVYTSLGNAGLLFIGAAVLMIFFKKTRRAGIFALLAMALGFLCTNVVLKNLVARPRPWLTVEGLIPLVAEHDPNSFPSGHTCAAFAAAGVWMRTLPKTWAKWTALAAAILMGVSRLYVGVHFPTDVLAGLAVGLICSQIVYYLGNRVLKNRLENGGNNAV
ncbi:MAG: phosphatase PAP2 family protein [Oscillospiraceae bacterium]